MSDQQQTIEPHRYNAFELAEFVKKQHKIITDQDILLVVKDQEIARLKAELLAARVQMDPYQVACEIASKDAPSNEDMRRLRAAEVAIAYCGRPKVSESRSMTVVGYQDMNGLAVRLKRATQNVLAGRDPRDNGDHSSPDESMEPPPIAG